MKNISHIKDCFGCGVCATICPKNIISISLNQDGFYEPHIYETDKCIECGLCLSVCAYSHDDLAIQNTPIHGYAGWSNNSSVRLSSTSGGVGFEIARYLLEKGYKVCGVRYNGDKKRAEHYIASSLEQLKQSVGSKYIQSYTVEAFKTLTRDEKYLITGTPCQIDSFRRFIQKKHIEEHFVLLDCFCHGIPSMWVWQKYLRDVEALIGDVKSASWRNKIIYRKDNTSEKFNWHDSYNLFLKGVKGEKLSRHANGDLFFFFFLGNTCLGKACYTHCKYKGVKSSADIRIGDCWGHIYQDNKEGVNVVIPFTSKGEHLIHQIDCTLKQHALDEVIEGQLKQNIRPHYKYEKIRRQLNKSHITLYDIYQLVYRYNLLSRCLQLISHPIVLLSKIKEKIN